MTLSETEKPRRQVLPGEAYLHEDAMVLPRRISIHLHDNGFDLFSYSTMEERTCQAIEYSETLIRCSLNDLQDTNKPYMIQLEAGLKTIFICFAVSDERDKCFTEILASVGKFLVLNQRSRKTTVKKKTSNPISPISPRPLSSWPSTKHFPISSLLNALDISDSAPCLSTTNHTRTNSTFSFRFPTLLVSFCNVKSQRRAQQPKQEATTMEKKPVIRSHTLPLTKYCSSATSCKQYSARNTFVNDISIRSSLETRAALGLLNIESGDMRQYFSRS